MQKGGVGRETSRANIKVFCADIRKMGDLGGYSEKFEKDQ
jgi:hypothetical protein